MKRTVLAALGILFIIGLATVLAVAATFYSIFGHSVAMQTGDAVGPATTIVDGYAAAFSIPTDSGVILVDAGVDPEATAIIDALSDQGFAPSDVKALFITHGHGDHIAGAMTLGAPVYAMSEEVDLIEGRQASDSTVGRLFGPNEPGTEVAHSLSDGESLTIDGVEVLALHVPGHTQGSAVYVIGDVAFLGDSATAHDDGTIVGAVGIFSEDLKQNAQELRDLARRLPPQVDQLAFGHSGAAPVEQLGAFARTVPD